MAVLNIIRFSSSSALVLWILLITFFVLRDSAANTQRVVGTMKMEANGNGLVTSGGNVLSTGQNPKSSSAVRDKRLQGRKMLAYDISTRRMMMTKGLNGETSKISSATHHDSVGKYEHEGKAKLIHVESKLGDHHRSDLLPVKVNLVGFTAFSADYHVPKPHPPKNN